MQTMSNTTLGKLIWVLIFGGLLLAVLGLVIQKTDTSVGWPMAAAGAVFALAGAVLLVVRARRGDST